MGAVSATCNYAASFAHRAAALDAVARKPTCYLLCVAQGEAQLFNAPGWIRLEQPRNGGVVFVHRERELLVVRARGVL